MGSSVDFMEERYYKWVKIDTKSGLEVGLEKNKMLHALHARRVCLLCVLLAVLLVFVSRLGKKNGLCVRVRARICNNGFGGILLKI